MSDSETLSEEFDNNINLNTVECKYVINPIDFDHKLDIFKIMYEKVAKFGSKAKQDFISLINTGKVGDFNVNNVSTNHDDFFKSFDIRMAYGNIMSEDYDTFKAMEENDIDLFHGTNINALPGIIKEGTKTFGDLVRNGEDVQTGEKFSRIKDKNRGFISLTNNPDIACEYARMGVESTEKTGEDFGILLGYSNKDISNLRTNRVILSEIPEIGVLETIPKEYLKLVAAKSDKIDLVKQIVGENPNIKVVPMDLDKRFYERVTPKVVNPNAKFSKEDLKKEAEKADVKGIKKILNKVKSLFQSRGKEEKDNDSQEK